MLKAKLLVRRLNSRVGLKQFVLHFKVLKSVKLYAKKKIGDQNKVQKI